MKDKIVKVLQNKRARYLIVTSVLVLFCFAMNIAFSAFTSTAGGVAANLNVKNMTYSVKIDGTAGTIVKATKSGLTKINTTFTATNSTASKYELSYDVCSDSTCSSTISKPSTLTVQYSSRTTDAYTGTITATGTVNIRVIITNNATSDVYIRLKMNAGYTHNTLVLDKKVTGPYNEDDLTIYSYINGKLSSSFPTGSRYSGLVTCEIDGGGTSNATGTATWDGSKWGVSVTGVDTGRTVCNVNFESIGHIISYSGAEVTYTIEEAGTYRITVYGAGGSQGNKYGNTSTTVAGGKGARVDGDFTLAKGDVLYINVGGMGSTTTGTAADGASGAGGGGTFVFKKISSAINGNIQFLKNGAYYEVLIVAAGGGGTGDLGYSTSKTYAGYDGKGTGFYSSSNYTQYSTTTTPGTSSSATTTTLGISQWVSYNLKGATYTRNSSVCTGGFGGGGCQDDQRSYGGGWLGSNYASYSFCNGTNCTGYDGYESSNGSFEIIKIS